MAHDEDRLRLYSNKLFDQAYALAFLSNVEAGDRKKVEDKRVQQTAKLQQEVERLRAEVDRLGLELANKTQEGFAIMKEKIELSNKIEDLKKEMGKEITRNDATQSFIVGFQTALE